MEKFAAGSDVFVSLPGFGNDSNKLTQRYQVAKFAQAHVSIIKPHPSHKLYTASMLLQILEDRMRLGWAFDQNPSVFYRGQRARLSKVKPP